jgi:hypothetical protein
VRALVVGRPLLRFALVLLLLLLFLSAAAVAAAFSNSVAPLFKMPFLSSTDRPTDLATDRPSPPRHGLQ